MNKFKTSKYGVVAVNVAIAAWKEVRHMANDGMAERVAQAIAAWNSRDWDAVRCATKGYSTTLWNNGAALRAYELLREIALRTPAVIGQNSHRMPYIAYAASYADAARKVAEWTAAHPRCTTSFRASGNLAPV